MQLNKETMMKVLDSIYAQALVGIPTAGTVEELADAHLQEAKGDREAAIDSLIRWQVAKNTANGVVANLGGILLLPVTLPLEITSSLYLQLRAITAIAHLSGHDIHSDEVKTMSYCCFSGDKLGDLLTEAGVIMGSRITASLFKALNTTSLSHLQKAVGLQLVSKFGKRGFSNLGKRIPFLGAAIGGTVEGAFAFYTARAAKQLFFQKADSSSSL